MEPSEYKRQLHRRFILALQREHLTCCQSGCNGALDMIEQSPPHAFIKSYQGQCGRCQIVETITGSAQTIPPWDVASISLMAEAHLLHDQPTCPFDDTPVTFISLPNPRRKGRYRIVCFYCGRHTEMNWPPPEAKN